MKKLFNIIILVFVLGTLYYAGSNPQIKGFFTGLITDIKENAIALKDQFNIPGDPSKLTLPKFNFGDITDLPNWAIGDTPADGSVATEASTKTPQPPVKDIPNLVPGKVNTPAPLAHTGSNDSVGVLSINGIVAHTNAQRIQNARAPLYDSVKLDASAKIKADDILANQYFEHVSPDGKSVSDLVNAQGYAYVKVGENLALGGFTDDADVVTAWMNSPGHRANILDGTYTEIGIGVARGVYQGRTVYVAVQHFGRPRSTCPTVDDSLRLQVVNAQPELEQMVFDLNKMKAEIEQGKKEGKDMSAQIKTYNTAIDAYEAKYNQIDTIRVQYNNQVSAYNKCVQAL